MRLRAAVGTLVIGAMVLGCRADTNVTDPNEPSSGTFWTTSDGAIQGINATYNSLIRLGTFQRWQAFSYDIRSDEGFSPSPWTDLSNFNKFTFVTYDFDVNRDTWYETYLGIFRANQVIANVPGISMDATLRSRIVGEAKFIRALYYFHLMTLYGGNIPLQLTPSSPTDQPASAGDAAVWAQIQKDLTDAIPTLPAAYSGSDIGRATSGAAQGLLGKVLLQQRKWAEAAAQLQPIVQSGRYTLVSDYATNFTTAGKNNQESLFEVQFGNPELAGSQSIYGLNIAKMVGACGPSYCDGRPTRWFFNQFFPDTTNRAVYDSRLNATMFWNHPGENVYGQAFVNPGSGRNANDVFFKKYSEYNGTNGDQSWEASLNYKVLRYSDILLMLAEALNEQGQPAAAAPYINQVRQRPSVALTPLATSLNQAQMRDAILHERLVEFGLESQRWLDLQRQNLFTAVVGSDEGSPACAARTVKAAGCDAEFSFFVVGKTELLPIPQSEIDLNPNVKQNPKW
ncbi:MAG: RagB/SusD protein [Gemmatimonadetes bacterium]|nr:RagB/SusD protein [Gemmatimonadota bacterium]